MKIFSIPALVGVLLAGLAWASAPLDFSIDPQPMQQALKDFARQSGYQVFFASDLAKGRSAPAVVGKIAPEEALEKLLANSGLSYRFVNARTVTIREEPTAGWVREGEGIKVAEGASASSSSAGETSTEDVTKGEMKLEEVVVTAQKRKERLQDVPISISVLSGRELDRSNDVSVNEVLNASVPGVATRYSSFPGTTQLSVRGVTAGGMTLSGSSTVAYYVDSVPFGFVRDAMVPDVGTFDLQQVEALRGPQGTLYGANAVNGVVRVLTNDADLGKVEFKGRTSVAGTEGGGASYRGDLAVNVPLIEDKLAARAAVSYANSAGWIDNLVKRDTNDSQLSDVRLKLNARPSDNLSIGLSYWHSKTDTGAFNLATNDDVYPGVMDTPTTIRFDIAGLKIGYELPGFSVSSMTSYIDYKNHNNYDITPFSDPSVFNVPSWYGQLGYNEQDSRVFSQEVNLSSKTRGVWRWTAGAFYRDVKDHLFQRAVYFARSVDAGDASKSFAAFGELTREFMGGKFALTGGLRYFTDDVTVLENVLHAGAAPNLPLQHDTDTFDKVSPRVVLTWHPVTQMTAYASYGEGFRSGFSQTGTIKELAPNFPPAKPDTLHNYEAGLKGALLDGKITYDSALYYIDWQHVQQLLIKPVGSGSTVTFQNVVVNGQSASGSGVDLNVMTRPLGGLEFGVNLNWNDLTFDENVVSNNAVLFKKGDRLNYSPKYTVAALAAYSFPMGLNDLQGRFSVSGSYHGPQIAATLFGSRFEGDDLLNMHVGFSIGARERWTTEIFVDNATNNRGNITMDDGIPFYQLRSRPRTIGLQFDCHFHN